MKTFYKRALSTFLFVYIALSAFGHSIYKVENYDSYTKNMLDIRHIGQDKKGFLWVSTSDGLYRFDGYRFKDFKPQKHSENKINNDAVEYMACDNTGNIWCKIENKVYLFDTDTYTFHNALEGVEKEKTYVVRMFRCLPDGTTCIVCEKGAVFLIDNKNPLSSARLIYDAKTDVLGVNHNKVTQEIWIRTEKFTAVITKGRVVTTDKNFLAPTTNSDFHTDRFGKVWKREDIDSPGIMRTYVTYADNQDNVWYVWERHLYRVSFHLRKYDKLETENASTRYAMKDSKGRIWISKRYANHVTVYDRKNNLLGYLGANGKIVPRQESFGNKVYCIHEDKYGNIWFGTKPNGIFMLKEQADGTFSIRNIRKENSALNDNEIIKIEEDAKGRLWACGFMKGLNIIEIKGSDIKITPVAYNSEKKSVAENMKVRDATMSKEGALMLATSKGLAIYDTRKDLKTLQSGKGVLLHQRNSQNPDGLNSSALKTAIQAHDGKIYICTQDAGIDLLTSKSIFEENLTFQHFCTSNGFPSDYVKAITEVNNTMWVTSINSLIEWNPSEPLPQSAKTRITLEGNDFSESTPVQRTDGTWLYGVMDGCIAVDIKQLNDKKLSRRENYPIVLTSENDMDTIVLASDERAINLSFSTLDYDNTENISYAVRFSGDGMEGDWEYLGETHNISFQHLKPGEYFLSLRSTDGTGKWLDNERTIIIKVTPTVFETWWWRTLQWLFIIGVIAVFLYFWKYIKKIQKQQRETLDAYMQLLDHKKEGIVEEQEEYRKTLLELAKIEPQNDDFIKKIMEYIEKNISSSDIDIDDMARYAAVSRSHLNHKLKQVLGVTPSEMIREARIKHACLLLKDYSRNINDIAYACGFTDPKYFSKCFKASTGYSPSNYRLRL